MVDRDILGNESTYQSNKVSHTYLTGGTKANIPGIFTVVDDEELGISHIEFVDNEGNIINDANFFSTNGWPLSMMYTSIGSVVDLVIEAEEIPFIGTEAGKDIPEADDIALMLKSINVPVGYESPITDARATFANCINLKYVDGRLFRNCVNSTDFSYMFANTNVRFIQPYAFNKCINLETVEGMFEGSEVRIVSPNLFRYNTKLSNISKLFHRCAGLRVIPDHLFDNNHELYDISEAFKFMPLCHYIPKELFTAQNHPSIVKCSYAFANGVNELLPAHYIDDVDGLNVHYFDPESTS